MKLKYQSPMILRGSMSKFAIGGSLGAKDNATSHLGPILRVSIEGWPQFTEPTVTNLTLGFSPKNFWESIYMWGSKKNFGAQYWIFHGRPIQSASALFRFVRFGRYGPFFGRKTSFSLVTLADYFGQMRHFLKGLLIFLSIPSCGILRKITKPFKKCLSWPRLASKVKISEIDTSHIMR